jgi:adenylate kinase family enzyme
MISRLAQALQCVAPEARRIVIVGTAGAGKSTLARRLGEELKIPVVHLDALRWEPGWKPVSMEVFRSRLSEAISGDAWITDGNYAILSFDLRMPRADLVIWVERPILQCIWRVMGRAIKSHFNSNERLAAGCTEHFDRKFWGRLRFIKNFDRVNRPRIEAARMTYGPHVPVMVWRGDEVVE